jgi:hypothetical protein
MIAVLASISAGRMAALYRFEPAGDLAQPVRTAEQVRIATSSYRNKFVSQQVRIADQGGQIVVALRAADD